MARALRYGVRVWGGGHLLSGGGVGVGLANELGTLMPVDLNTHNWQSLRFDMRNGPGVAASQDVEIIISDAYSEPSGGLCRPQPFEESPCSSESDGSCTPQGCLDSPRAIVTSTSEWQTFEIPFDDFLRPGDGRYEPGVAPPPSLDVTRAYQLQFRAPAGTPEFDLWIDNVAFVSVGP